MSLALAIFSCLFSYFISLYHIVSCSFSVRTFFLVFLPLPHCFPVSFPRDDVSVLFSLPFFFLVSFLLPCFILSLISLISLISRRFCSILPLSLRHARPFLIFW